MIRAGYRSKCPGCGDTIYMGEAIGLVDDEWVCESCVNDNGGEDDE